MTNIKKIRDVATVVRGASPRPAGNPKYFNGDYLPWITVGDITKSKGMYLLSTDSYLTKEGAKFTRKFHNGTLLLTNSGATLGVPKITSMDAGANDGVAGFVDLAGVVPEYLYFYFEHKTEYLRKVIAPGVGQPNLNTDLIGDLDIYVPSVFDQNKIVHFSSLWSSSIEKAERLIVLKEQAYRVLSARLYSSAQEGRLVRVEEICHEISDRNGGQFDRVLSVTNHSGFVLPEVQFSKRVASEDLSNYKIVRRGQYAYNPSRINVGSIARLDKWDEGVLSPMYTVFELESGKVDSDYFLHWLSSPPAKKSIAQCAQGSVRETVAFSDFSAMNFPLAEASRQRKIAQLLNVAREEIDLLQGELALLAQQKSFLMSKLLSGEWEAPDLGAEAN